METLTKPLAFKELSKFCLPIIFGHIGVMLIGTMDMLVAGRFSSECLAAIGLAISIVNPIMMLGLGLLFAVSPLLAQKRGRGEGTDHYFWSVMLYALLVGAICSVAVLLSVSFVPLFGYTPNLTRLIQEFIRITSFSMIGVCLYQGLKEVLQAEEKTFLPNFIAIVAVGVNYFFNFGFVFGRFGLPDLDEAGIAWATLSVRFFMGFALLVFVRSYFNSEKKIHWSFIREVFNLGLPITISIFFEVMAFCSVTLFVGKFAEEQIAANNIALNIGSLSFMIPLSIAAAAGVKVGHAYGERSYSRIRIFSFVSILMSLCFTLTMSTIFYVFPEYVISFYSKDPAVLEWGRRLIFWVACFQLFDGAQVTIGGILRGMGITRPASIAIFIGYWIIGIPLGYYLGYYAGHEAQGFWIGLALSLALVACMLAGILRYKLKKLH